MSAGGVDASLQSAVRLLKQVFLMRAERSGPHPMARAVCAGADWTLAGYTETQLHQQLDSVDAFVFLEELEERYSVELTDVRQLLIDRLADPWVPLVRR